MQKTTKKKSSRPSSPARITSAAQFDALASPVRDQIAQVVVNQAARAPDRDAVEGVSIREIAEQLGRRPASLYRHIEALVDARLIIEVGAQTSGGRDATTYAPPGDYLQLVTPKRAGPPMDAMCRYIKRMATHAGEECAAATRERSKTVREGDLPDDFSFSMFGWLDADQQHRLREVLDELVEIFEHTERRPDTKLIAASLLVRPVRLPGGKTSDSIQD